MKTLLWMVPVMCLASMAHAADVPETARGTAAAVPDASLSGTSPPHYRVARGKKVRLPGGDLRSCLERTSPTEIIRCSETRRKHKQ